jgi:SAM-dependent methyltransferase
VKPSLLVRLVCPLCQGELTCDAQVSAGDEIVEGVLTCGACQHRFPIRGGVPRLNPPGLALDKQRTAEAFGFQWTHFVELHEHYRAQFLDWIRPLGPDFFRDKVVLDAGCGMGRHTLLAAAFGAREVIGLDLSEAVETAYTHTRNLPNVHIVQADINHLPFRAATFDFIFAIGVLHHLPNPEGGFRSLLGALKPGGTVAAWVYGYENNGPVRALVDPLRRHVTTKLHPAAVRVVAWPLAVLFHLAIRAVYVPLHGTSPFRLLPLREYVYSLRPFGFRQNYNIVFDHLVAPTAFYLRREEFAAWFERAGLAAVQISSRNHNSWRGLGVLPP